MNRFARSDAGFTILEVAVAMSVAAVALLGMMAAVYASMQLTEASRETGRAVQTAREIMERVKATPFANVQTQFGGMAFPVTGLRALPSDSDGQPGGVTVTVVTADLLRVQVQVDWKGVRGDGRYAIETQLLR